MAIGIRSVASKKISATKEFTDRVEPRKAFWDNYEKMKSEGTGILTYYGAGGLGKSRLIKELKSELDKKNEQEGKGKYKYIAFDFNGLINQNDINVRDVLQSLKTQLAYYGCEFPLFEAGDFYYSMIIGKNVNPPKVKSIIDESPMLSKLKDKLSTASNATENLSPGLSVAASLLNVGVDVADVIPGLKAAKKIFGFLDRAAAMYVERNKELDEEHAEIKRKMDELTKDRKNPNRLYDYLPILFAQDVRDWIIENNEHLVIFLDTYEVLVNETSAERFKRERDLWLKSDKDDGDNNLGIVFLLPQVLWVIAGRNKIRWSKELDGEMDQHLLEALSYDDSNYFLKTAGVANQELRDGIIKLTKGSPIYLDLCVDTYTGYWNQNGKEPSIEEFGQNHDAVVERMIKYMDAGTKDMIRSLCALKVWTDEMAAKIIPNFSPSMYGEQIKNFSFIQPQAIREGMTSESYAFDRTVHGILFDKFTKDSGYLNKEIRDRANNYFNDIIEKTDKNAPLFSFYLELWADNIARLTTDAEELKSQYEKYLEKPVKSLDWRMYGVKANVVEIFFNRTVKLTDTETLPYAFFLYQYGKVKRNQNEYKVAYKYMQTAYEKFVKLVGNENEYTMKALYSLAKMAGYVGHDKESAELLDKYAGLCKKVLGQEDEKTLSIMKDLAYAYNDLEEHKKEVELYKDILAIIEKKYNKTDQEYLDARLDVARALKYNGQEEEANVIEKEVLDTLNEKLNGFVKNIEKLDADTLIMASKVVDEIGMLLFIMKGEWEDNFRKEIDIRRNVIQIYEKVLGLENEKTIDALIDYAETLACGLIDEAYKDEIRILCEKLLKCGELLYGKDDERMLHIYDRIDFCSELADLDDMKAAANSQILRFRQDMAKEYKNYYGDGDEKTIKAMIDVANQLRTMDKKEEELKLRKDILDICRKYFGDKNERTLDALDDLAFFFNEKEDYEEELKIQNEILSVRKELDGDAGEETISAMRDIAITLDRMERFDEELTIKKNILEILNSNNGINRDVFYAMEDLAQTLREREKFSEELPLRQKVLELNRNQYGEDSEETIRAKISVADVTLLLKEYDETLKIWSEIANSRESNKGKTHKLRISAELVKVYVLCEAGKYEDALNLTKEILSIYSSDFDEPMRQKLLCAKILCFMLIATDKSNLSNKEEMKDKILSLFGWIGYHDRMHGDENFYGLHPEATIDGFIRISEELTVKSSNGYKECMTEALKLAKSALGEDNEKTKKINELLENI